MICIIPSVILTEMVFCGVERLSHCKDRDQERDFHGQVPNTARRTSTVSERERKQPMTANTTSCLKLSRRRKAEAKV